jgi:hypothetical protein
MTAAGKIEIINLIGKKVTEVTTKAGEEVIPVSINLPSGTYLVRILENGQPLNTSKLRVK